MAGAPLGNRNGAKENRLWGETIRRAVTQHNGKKLRDLADQLIKKAEEGDIQALRELGDRIDGKPAQAIVGPDNGPLQVMEVPWLPARSR